MNTPRQGRTPRRYRSPNGKRRPYQSGGRWYAEDTVTLPDGTTVTVRGTGKTQAAAKQRCAQAGERAVTEARTPKDVSIRTVGGWCQHWLDHKQIRPKTKVGYQTALDRWIIPAFGDLSLNEVTLEMIEDLHLQVQDTGLSRAHWVHVRTVLNQAFTEALKRGHVTHNPAQYAPAPAPVKRSQEHLSETQARRVIAACTTDEESARWLIALTLGLRQGEALGLTWAQVDLDSTVPLLRVRHTLQRVTGRGLVTGPPKTARSVRDLEMSPVLTAALRKHRTHQREVFLGRGLDWTDATPVFASPTGWFRDPSRDRQDWVALLARAEVDYVKPHAARHTTATLLLNEGADLKVVSDALGHSSVAVTADTYAHVAREVIGAATTSLAGRLAG